MSEDTLDQILEDRRAARLQPANAALLDFVVKIGSAGSPVSPGDIGTLHAAGLADEQVLEGAQVAALGGFLRTLATGLGVEADFPKRRIAAREEGIPQDSGAGRQNTEPTFAPSRICQMTSRVSAFYANSLAAFPTSFACRPQHLRS